MQVNGGTQVLSSSTGLSLLSHEKIDQILQEESLPRWGLAKLKTPFSFALYEDWIKKGYHGEMAYLERHLPEKKDPKLLMKRASSAIVITTNYLPHPESEETKIRWPLSGSAKVASYAQGRDYHHFLKARLARVIEKLKCLAPNEEFASFTDSSPVLERDLAARAGLGWIGKNTCLISRGSGSLFFISEIYTSIDFQVAELPVTDHCGTCTRCLDACPTGALVAAKELDARKCISYLTIESREVAQEPLREKIGSWLFGCDICQTVCPWNIKFHGAEKIKALENQCGDRKALIEDLCYILSSSNRALERAFLGTPLARAGSFGLKRNAIVIAANQNVFEVTQLIEKLLDDKKLGDLANWALKKISPATLPVE